MNTEMSEITRQEVLAKKRDRYARAGREHKGKIITELVELFGYHPKAAIRALRPRGVRAVPFVSAGFFADAGFAPSMASSGWSDSFLRLSELMSGAH